MGFYLAKKLYYETHISKVRFKFYVDVLQILEHCGLSMNFLSSSVPHQP